MNVRYEKRVDYRTKALWIAKRNPLDSKGPFNNYVDKKSTLVHLFQNVFHTIVHWICTYITLH